MLYNQSNYNTSLYNESVIVIIPIEIDLDEAISFADSLAKTSTTLNESIKFVDWQSQRKTTSEWAD